MTPSSRECRHTFSSSCEPTPKIPSANNDFSHSRYNGGRGDPATGGGSSFYWRKQDGAAYAGLAAGTCIFYADLDGNGRADEHYVTQSFNNIAYTSLSPSCGNVDVTGDDPNMVNDLPTPPGKDPETCTAGTGDGDLADLCAYTCSYNYW